MQCNRGLSLNAFLSDFLLEPDPVKIALIGCGCSVATESVAEISHLWNVSQVLMTIVLLYFSGYYLCTFYKEKVIYGGTEEGIPIRLRPLQYDSLFLVLPPAYSRNTRILGRSLFKIVRRSRDSVRAMRLAIAMVFLSATVVQGSKGTTFLPWKLYNATPFEVSFIFWFC